MREERKSQWSGQIKRRPYTRVERNRVKNAHSSFRSESCPCAGRFFAMLRMTGEVDDGGRITRGLQVAPIMTGRWGTRGTRAALGGFSAHAPALTPRRRSAQRVPAVERINNICGKIERGLYRALSILLRLWNFTSCVKIIAVLFCSDK